MRVEESVTIEAPREKVWEWVADPSRADKFMSGVRYRVIEGEPTTGLRARYELRMKVRSAEVGGVVEVIEFDPPHEIAWTSITGIDQRGRWMLRDEGGRRTKVTCRLSYQVPGGVMGLVADRIGSPLVRRNVRRSLGALKRMLEVR